jgi:hypothetical protein
MNPLNHFERGLVVDLQTHIFESDGQIPTVYPTQFFGLEFTEKLLLTKHWQFRRYLYTARPAPD